MVSLQQHYDLCLIDIDSLAYKAGVQLSKKEAYQKLWERFDSILSDLHCNKYIAFLGKGKSTFRHKLDPNYKANRKGKEPPKYMGWCKDALIELFHCNLVTDIEAEDAVGQCLYYHPDAVICHIDSDLNQLPGTHYNYDKGIISYTSPDEALRYYWKMVLSGSSKDNVKGLYRYTNGNFDEDFAGCITYDEYDKRCLEVYQSHIHKHVSKKLDEIQATYLPTIPPMMGMGTYIKNHYDKQKVLQRITYGKEYPEIREWTIRDRSEWLPFRD